MHAGSLESTTEDFPSASITRFTHAKKMNQFFITLLTEICDEKTENLVKTGKNR